MNAHAYANQILAGDRAALSRAITLAESTRPADRSLADGILMHCMPHTGRALRLAVTGAPGVGKSSLIEALGLHAVAQNTSVSVLAIDPSSTRTGGSILGDKTRMPALSRHDRAYVRPSPSAGSMGGIRRATRDSMLMCEAAGFRVVMIETVGAGQSEYTARHIADLVLVLVQPHAGDELQGIKQGVLEVADMVAVTKSDHNAVSAAQATLRQYRRALAASPARPHGVPVMACSAVTGEGIADLWQVLRTCEDARRSSGELKKIRSSQVLDVILEESGSALVDKLLEYSRGRTSLRDLCQKVESGQLSVRAATQRIVSSFLRDSQES